MNSGVNKNMRNNPGRTCYENLKTLEKPFKSNEDDVGAVVIFCALATTKDKRQNAIKRDLRMH